MGVLKFGVILFAVFYNTHAYQGKVFDHTPKFNQNDAGLTMELNLQDFLSRMNNDDNVVVFPEYGLTSMIVLSKQNLTKFGLELPEANSNVNFCNNESKYKILKQLACSAIENKIYLLANVIEASGGDFYNTNLVFDPTGVLIAKYRKINLNEEETGNLKAGTEIVTFNTEYGKFTTFTGSDILHENPALKVIETGATDVLHPSALFSNSPFWSSLSIQDGYAISTGANLLASSYNAPKNANGGSGIYHGKERKDVQIQAISGTSAVVSELEHAEIGKPKCLTMKSAEEIEGRALQDVAKLFVMKNALSEKAKIKQFDLPQQVKEFQAELCSSNEQLCCKLNANIFNPISEVDPHYKFIMYSKGDSYACGLVSCQSNDIESCGRPISTSKNNQFTLVRVEAYHKEKTAYEMPSTLRYNMKPVSFYEYCSSAGNVSVELKQQHSLVTFGIIYSDATKINCMLFATIISLIISRFL